MDSSRPDERATAWVAGDAERGETIVAYVAADSAVGGEVLKQFLLSRLPSWQIPRKWRFVEALQANDRGKLSRADLNNLFETSGLLCCTSMLEGFPTTFLEAWSCGLPVVTTFDPDGIVARQGLGQVVTTADELVAQLRALPNTDAYPRMSRAAKSYFLENYSVETISRQFRIAFEELVAK